MFILLPIRNIFLSFDFMISWLHVDGYYLHSTWICAFSDKTI